MTIGVERGSWANSELSRQAEAPARGTLEDHLHKIVRWANKGTLEQFQIEAQAKLRDTAYETRMVGDTLTFYRARTEGGILGIGGRTVREPVMQISPGDTGAEISLMPLDPEFAELLSSELEAH